jgi:CHAT domain-containing protein
MRNQEPLQEILRDRDCDGMTPEDLTPLTLRMGFLISCGNVTFVDWVFETASGRMKVFSATCIMGHYNLQIEDVHDFTMPEAVAWVQANLNHRVLSNADLADHKLKELAPLVAPLRKITKPGSVLVLCPTFELHKIPLHALPIDDDCIQILLERNPIVYIPSLTILHHLARLNQHGSVPVPATRPSHSPPPPPIAVVLSVYDPANASNTRQSCEAAAVKSTLTTIATTLHTTLQAGKHVNVPFWSTHTRDAALIHFHGHAVSAPNGAHQALVLQPTDTTTDIGTDTPAHHLTARKILTMNFTCSPIVVNIACASGSAELKAGDELFGLTPAFLLAGAQSVVGTMWPIKSADGRAFTEAFYGELGSAGGGEGQGAVVDLARALQKAVLRIRDEEKTEAPYHWASFTVCGLWKVPWLSGPGVTVE